MVTLWRVPLVAPHALPADRVACLDDHERRRAHAFADAALGLRWQLVHVALREILGAALGVAPKAVGFQRYANGRCTLHAGEALQFSLSHAPDLALIAVGTVEALGVDVEQERPIPGRDDVLHAVFTPSERETIATLPPDQAHRAFLRGWTRKEAVAKALGIGLEAMARVEVTLEPENARVRHLGLMHEHASLWSLADLHLESPFVGALAVRGPSARYEIRDWTIS